MHFPRATDPGCGGIVIEDAAEVLGHRSLGLSAGSYCEHGDHNGFYYPRKGLVLHEKSPNLRFAPLFSEAPRAAGDVRAHSGDLQLNNCAPAISRMNRAHTIERLEGYRQTAMGRNASISQFAVECCALPWSGRASGGTIRLPRFAMVMDLTGERDG